MNPPATIGQVNDMVAKINAETTAKGNPNGKSYIQLPSLTNGIDTNIPSKPTVVSSNSPLDGKQKVDATNQAAGALVTNSNDAVNPYQLGMDAARTAYMDAVTKGNNDANANFNNALNAQQLVYDSSLASSNQKYAQLQSQLQAQYHQSLSIATANAAALNPYATAVGAQTSANFNNKITEQYQQQALSLQQQADAAQKELAAQNYQAYVTITSNMQKSNDDFNTTMSKFILDSQKQSSDQFNSDRSYKLDVSQFDFQKSQEATKQFMDFVNNFGADPTLRGEMASFLQTGKATDGIQPIIDKGVAAGYSPDEAVAIAQHNTLDQSKLAQDQSQFSAQMQLGWYNAQTSRINATKTTTNSNISENGYVNTDPTVGKALQQALAGKGMTDSMRAQVTQLFDAQGLPGAFAWAAVNKFSSADQSNYSQYQSSAEMLNLVANDLSSSNVTSGPYKALLEANKPWVNIQRDSQYTNLFQTIGVAQAGIKHGFYGSALTGTELQDANKFLINDSDSVATIAQKAQGLSSLLRYANDKKAASALGVGDTIHLSDYIDTSDSENKVNFSVGSSEPVGWSYVN